MYTYRFPHGKRNDENTGERDDGSSYLSNVRVGSRIKKDYRLVRVDPAKVAMSRCYALNRIAAASVLLVRLVARH